MRPCLCIVLAILAASCGEQGAPAIPASLASLQATADEPSSITEAELRDLTKEIAWPGVAPFGVVAAVDGWNVVVRVDGDAREAAPGTRMLVTHPRDSRGVLRVHEARQGFVLGRMVSIVPGRVVSVGDYAQPLP